MAIKKGIKILAENRKAYHDYFIEERFEAGVALSGTEVKSLRAALMIMETDLILILKETENSSCISVRSSVCIQR